MQFKDTAAQFASTEIAPFANPEFATVFKKAAAAGLCGIGLPEEFGGSGGGWPEIIALGRELARHGGDAGTAFSLMYHLSVSRFMLQGCGLRLEGCRVSESAVIGKPGAAYPDIVLPFRPLEDALTTGLITGGLERIFAAALKDMGGSASGMPRDTAGRLYSILTALDAVSLRAAAVLESGGINRELEGLNFWFREMAREFISIMAELPGYEEGPFGKDIRKLVDLGKNVSFLKQAKTGETLLKKGFEQW